MGEAEEQSVGNMTHSSHQALVRLSGNWWTDSDVYRSCSHVT